MTRAITFAEALAKRSGKPAVGAEKSIRIACRRVDDGPPTRTDPPAPSLRAIVDDLIEGFAANERRRDSGLSLEASIAQAVTCRPSLYALDCVAADQGQPMHVSTPMPDAQTDSPSERVWTEIEKRAEVQTSRQRCTKEEAIAAVLEQEPDLYAKYCEAE